VPTARAFWLVTAALLPAVFAALAPSLGLVAFAVDLAVLALVMVDFGRAPRASALLLTRVIDPIVSSGVTVPVELGLELAPGQRGEVRGEVRDLVPAGVTALGARQRFTLVDRTTVAWSFVAQRRGDLVFSEVWLRLEGPWGLCARQERVPLPAAVQVFPDLRSLSRDAVALARVDDAAARRVPPMRAEGREFESLREYRPGDDRRTIDWKATARRGRAMTRVHQPERNQQVLLLIDCGRHMAGLVGERRKIDHAVDAALRLAKVSLDQGDQVGVVAFGATVLAALPARRGAEQLNAIARALYKVDASLDESDYGKAVDFAFARSRKRSLVVVLTDLLDADSSAALGRRLRGLVPRHLPLIVSLKDEGVDQLAHALPVTDDDARARLMAGRLDRELVATVARLREAGARVVRETPARFGAASVSAYLDIKGRGLL
jgi:uncharacterized protein (DUF58 family)